MNDNFRNQIEHVFPKVVVSVEEIDGIAPEVGSYMTAFGGRSWDQVNAPVYRMHNDAYCLMAFSTLTHFIAGFMASSLDDPGGDEFLVYFSGGKAFCEFFPLLSPAQQRIMIRYLDWAIQDDYYSGDDRNRYRSNRDILVERHSVNLPANG